MIGYLFLAISALSGTTKGYCGKRVSEYVKSLKGTVFVNLTRMFLCIIVGFFTVFSQSNASFKIDLSTALITLLSGLSTAVFVILWITSLRSGAYVMLDVFIMLGVGVTIALCNIFFKEEICFNQLAGFVLLIISASMMCSYSTSVKGRLSLKNIILLTGIGLSNGLTDFSQKLFVYNSPRTPASVFSFYTYVFAFLIFVFFYLTFNHKEENDGKQKRVILYVVVMSVCLFLNSYFKTLAAVYISSATLYPLSTGISLILSLLMASFIFKEKVTPKCIFSAILAFVSLVIINL